MAGTAIVLAAAALMAPLRTRMERTEARSDLVLRYLKASAFDARGPPPVLLRARIATC